jgi:hypothetical protein
MEPTHGDYDIDEVDGIDALRSAISEMYKSDDPAGVLAGLLLNGHEGVSGYLTFGNNKVSKNTGIFNMNSATDCPNADSDEDNPTETGVCQVPWKSCYAHKSENVYPDALKKRRLQEYLWDCTSADIFAEALLRVKSRKRSPFKHLRVSESGDFRHSGDIKAWDEIARRLDGEINVYTYSASHKLSGWDSVEHFTVNQSNALADYGDREFNAVPTQDDIPDDAIACPFEVAKANGVETDKRPKCGECEACIKPATEQSRDVYVLLH